MDLKETECGGVDWISLAWDRIKWWVHVQRFIDKLNYYQFLKKECALWSWLVGWLVGWMDGWMS